MKALHIYTDGSHLNKQNKRLSRLGCGGVLVDPNGGGKFGRNLNEFSERLDPLYMKQYYGTDDCSNPTAEMMGVLIALDRFKDSLIDPSVDNIKIFADYEGVKYWMTEVWTAKKPYIRRIKDEINTILQEYGISEKVEFEWVKGHQSVMMVFNDMDAYWNDYVDHLAKGEQ